MLIAQPEFNFLKGDATAREAFGEQPARTYDYDDSDSAVIPIEPPEPGPGEP